MIRCIAIDDEPLALGLIQEYCKSIDYVELLNTFTSTEQAIEFIESNALDFIFLDINMPDIDGINFFKQFANHLMVVFTTAYSEYAIDGFNVQAVDYLLKPFNKSRLEKACEKVRDLKEYKSSSNSKSQNFMMVKEGYGLQKVLFDEILFLESKDDYVKIVLSNSKHVLTKSTTKGMLEKLPQDKFIRIHRSFIVNKDFVASVRANEVFVKNKELPIGTSYKKEIESIFK